MHGNILRILMGSVCIKLLMGLVKKEIVLFLGGILAEKNCLNQSITCHDPARRRLLHLHWV